MYKIAFYISIGIYFYQRWFTQNPEMINYSFHGLVLFGLLTLIDTDK
jgi:hypothetical protein